MNLLKEFKNATIVFLALVLVFISIHYFLGYEMGWRMFKETLITNSLFTYAFYFSNLFLTFYLDRWMPWSPFPKKRAVIGTALSIIINFLVVCVVITLVKVYAYGGNADYIFTNEGKGNVIITFVIVALISLLFYSVGFFKEMQEQKVLNEKLRKEKISAELNALKSQVNPHFLFNSFNVLSGLIDENPPQAQKFLSGLSKIYRYVLENRNEDLTTLSDEIEFAKQYLDLQKIRFENSIYLDLDIDDSMLEMQLPALSLQLLLENAITHNGFDMKSPLRISLRTIDQILVVSNNKKPRNKLSSGNGMGLENIKQRYGLQKIDRFKFEETKHDFIVHLPLVKQ